MKIPNKIKSLVVLIILLPLSGSLAQESLTAREIVVRSQEVGKLTGSESIITMRIVNKRGKERIRKISSMSKSDLEVGIEKRLIIFVAPADVKGTGMLIFDHERKDDNMWLYMPALRKTRRIVSRDKSKSFMGSEFTNADISTPNIDEYQYSLLGAEILDDTDCWQIEAFPRDEEVADVYGYSRKIICIGKKDFVARRVVYYDYDGEIWKELLARNIQLMDEKNKKYQALEITMVNKQNGRKSIMKFDQIQYNPDVEDEYFTIRYLEKAG